MYRLEKPHPNVNVGSSTDSEPSSAITIPVSVFADRSLASLEAVVEYMKEKLGLSYHQIAVLLHRDDRTIWTCYNRAHKKRLNE